MNYVFPVIGCTFVLSVVFGALNKVFASKIAGWPKVLAWFNLPVLSMCPIVVMLTTPSKRYFEALVVGVIYFFILELGSRLIRQGLPKGHSVLF